MSRIITYVLSRFPGVADIADLDPFAGLARPKVKEVTRTVNLKGSGMLRVSETDETLVSSRVIMIRYTKNPSDTEVVRIKRAFSHPAAADEDAEFDKIMVAMDCEPRIKLTVPPKDDSAKSVFIMKESSNCMYLQAPFVRTCMLIDPERNLMHGIIPLESSIWKGELPEEAVVFDERRQAVVSHPSVYYLVPFDHILAYCLKVSDHWRRMKGIFALEMDVTRKGEKASFIKYFAVADESFERLKAKCITNFLTNKVDKRPLNTIGFEATGYVEVVATFGYLEYPQDVMPHQVAPVMDPHFVPYAQILQAEVEAIRAREEEIKAEKKRNNV